MKRNRVVKQITSLLLSTAMVLSLMPTGIVYAAEEGSSTEVTTEVTTESTTEETTEMNTQYQDIGEDTEESTEVTTEAVSEETTEAVSEETTEAVTEETTETTEEVTVPDTETDKTQEENVTDIDNDSEEGEDTEESFIVFDHEYSDVNTLVVNTESLFVETSDPSVFTKNTTVESNYDNAYIISFGSVEEARYAYSYYYDKVDLITDMSNVVNLADDEATNTDAEDVADMSSVNEGDDAIANLNDISINNYSGYIALIDSGVSNAEAKTSVLGDSGADSVGHGTKMYNYIKDEYSNAKVLSIKAFDGSSANAADIYAAVKFAIESRVSVINLSFTAPNTEKNEVIKSIIQEAVNNGITVIGAAGNNSANAKNYIPGCIDGVITVGAVNDDGSLYKTSNYNADLYVVATSTSEATARYSGIYVSAKDSDKVYKELATDPTENDEEENTDEDASLAYTDSSHWYEIINEVFGYGLLPSSYGNKPSWAPDYISANGMTINVGDDRTNYTGHLVSFGTLTYHGGTVDPSTSILYGADNPGIVPTACYDHLITPIIDRAVPPAGNHSIDINLEYAGCDASGWVYYCNVYDGYVPTYQRELVYICIQRTPWRRYIKVKKVDAYNNTVSVTGCDLDVYNAAGTSKIGDMTDNGDGTYTWHSDYMTEDNYQNVSIKEVKGSGIYNNSSNNEKFIQTNGTLGTTVAALSTDYEYQGEELAVYPIKYTVPQSWNARLRIKKDPEHPALYNSNYYNLNSAVYKIYKTRENAMNDTNSIATLTTKTVDNVNGYTDWADVSAYMDIVNGSPVATTFYAKEITASKGYYTNTNIASIVVNPNSSSEVTYTFDEPEEVWVYLKKTSANTSCTNGNPNYDLNGATYKVFDDRTLARNALNSGDYSKAIMTFTCDSNGNTTKQKINKDYLQENTSTGGVTNTTLYVVESAPGAKGYTRTKSVIEVNVTPTNDYFNPALINVKDEPVDDPINLTVQKEDALYGTVEALEGVQFRFDFYPEDISTIRSAQWLKANSTPSESITRTTDKNGVIQLRNDVRFPRGFLVVTEVSNPDEYSMNDIKVYLNGDKTKEISDNLVFVMDAELTNNGTSYKGKTWYPNGATTYAELATKGIEFDDSVFTFTVTNTPVRGDIYINKMDETTGEPMANVKFRITNNETKEVHYFYTDENGFATTKTTSYDNVNYYDNVADYDGTDATVWFRKFEDKESEPNNDYAALPCGTYEVKEMRCTANEGYQLEKAHTITIDADHTYVNILDPNASENENKLWNTVKPSVKTTAIVKYSDNDTNTNNKTLAQQGSDVDWTNQTIIDTVSFEKLRAGTTYTLLSELMILDRNGDVTPYLEGETPYKRVNTFTTTADYKKSIYEITDSIDIKLDSIDPTGLEESQKKLVVYETLYYGDYDSLEKLEEAISKGTIATRYEEYDENDDMDFFPIEHKDKEDTFQTVTPGDIHTTILESVSEDRIAHTSPESTLTDTVYYTGLTVGEEYTVSGTLQAKEGTDWSKIKYDPTDPNADEDGYVYSTETNEDTDGENEENLPDTEDEDFNKNPNKAYTLRDAEGNPITASTTFVAESSEGYVDIVFNFDSSLVEGKSVVAFEELKYKDIIIAVHNDLHDEDETVHYPKFGTTTKNGKIDIVFEGEEQASKEVLATSGESFVDTIHYHNLLANRTYKAKGVLMDKETGEALKDATGKVITAETTFTTDEVAEVEMTESPDAFNFTTEDGTVLDLASDHANYLCDGDVDVVFEGYDFTNLADKVGVVFEEIYLVKDDNEIIVGEHKDINDVDQFIYFIEVHTNANDRETKIPVVPQDKQTTIEDTVSFKNVIVGKKYKLTATLKVVGDKSGKYKDGDTLLDKDGKPVTVDFEFTPKTTDGEVVVNIPFDTTNLRDLLNIVVFEDMYNIYGIKVAAHNDLTDKDQTVRVPGGGTTAKDKATGDNVAQADKNITLVDTITYKNLEPGKEYTATGTLYSKETKKPIQVNGVDFTKTVKFTPTEPNGTVDVVFEFSTKNLKGATLVVFEDVKYNNESVFIHADIDDEGQTVHIPEIGTTATVGNGQKSAQAAKTITIVDRVAYKNLIVGKEYTISGVLWNKATSEKLVVNGKNVTASKTFTADKANGYVDLTFTFDATGFSGDIVVGETLKHNDIEVATHTDLTDEGQTVTITPPPVTPPKTGIPFIPIAIGGFGTALVLAVVLYFKKKKQK